MNTTSSTGLMQALNAQMAANQAAAAIHKANQSAMSHGTGNDPPHHHHHGTNTMSGMIMANDNNNNHGVLAAVQEQHATFQNAADGRMAMRSNTLSNLSNSSNSNNNNNTVLQSNTNRIMMVGQQQQQPLPLLGNSDTMIAAPGDSINGKKRVSPSVPLHPSQLQLHHGSSGVSGVGQGIIMGGGAGGGLSNLVNNHNLVMSNTTMGMNAVAEEGEESLMMSHHLDTTMAGHHTNLQGQLLQQQQQLLLQPRQVLTTAVNDHRRHQGTVPQGLLGAALGSSLPQASDLLAAAAAVAVANHQHQHQQPSQQQHHLKKLEKLTALNSKDDKKASGGEVVLTHPSVPSANSGMDNSEGNLIVRSGDVLRVPRKNMHSHPPTSSNTTSTSSSSNTMSSGASSSSSIDNNTKNKKGHNNSNNGDDDGNNDIVEYRVVSLLGQGTFAQVFHCVETSATISRGRNVAVKIVKNKPAYTRQAAVEIDVFRKLNSASGSATGDGGAATKDGGGESEAAEEDTTHGTTNRTKGSESTSALGSFDSNDVTTGTTSSPSSSADDEAIIRLKCYFMHSSHLCLVFEMLGPNLYELLKKRQFRGLPMGAVRILVQQATEGIKLLGKKNVVHCDLKPENILMVRSDVERVIGECKGLGDESIGPQKIGGGGTTAGGGVEKAARGDNATSDPTNDNSNDDNGSKEGEHQQYIKLIDFGSACFEGQTTHTYIQSRFYRSPEVLIGLPYDSAIDIWSLGCVAAELFLGLPILPGVHEHDQLGRILEMIGGVPDWMLEQGSKSGKFFKKKVIGPPGAAAKNSSSHFGPTSQSSPSGKSSSSWEFKSRQEYISFLTEEEKRSKGGLSKLEQQQTNRYFKKQRLEDIVMHHGVSSHTTKREREQLGLFVHFLKGVLDPDPWKRWTAHQASMHPFLTGSSVYRVKSSSDGGNGGVGGGGVKPYDIHWVPPWDASISRRKLLVIQKTKEKAAAAAAQQQAAQQHAQQAAQAQAVSINNRVSRRLSLNDTGGSLRNSISQSVPETSAVVMPGNMQVPYGLDTLYGSPLRTMTSKQQQQQQQQFTEIQSPSAVSVTSQMAAMADAMSLERARSNISNISGKSSPPQSVGGGIGGQMYHPYHPAVLSASLSGVGMPFSYQQLADIGAVNNPNLVGRSFSENLMHHHQHPADQIAAAVAQQQHQHLQALNDVAFLQPPSLPPPPAFMGGAQSFSGAYGYQGGGAGGMPNSHHPYVESELGYALQRPGVVPGMGSSDHATALMGAVLRRQSSLANQQQQQSVHQHQQQMLSASLSNLSSSTPQNYGGAPPSATGPMNYHHPSAVSMSPGGLLLQKLGLQEQMLAGNQSHHYSNNAGGGGSGAAGTSLLAQQLEEYSHSDMQQQMGQQQHPQVAHDANNAASLMGHHHHQHSFSSNNTPGRFNPGSYHGGGYDNAAPMSLTASQLPYNLMQSASFSDFGSGNNNATSSSMQHQQYQQNLAAHLQQQHPHHLRMNASFPVIMQQGTNNGMMTGEQQQQQQQQQNIESNNNNGQGLSRRGAP